METYNLSTSQNVTLQYRVASVGDRMIATLLDGLFLSLTLFALILIIEALLGWSNTSPVIVLLFLPFVFYHFVFETLFNGQSLGKMILRIKVVKANGSQLTAGSCFIRWIFRLIDIAMTSGMLATVFIILNGKGQRLGDLLAATTVLKLSKKSELNDTIWVALEEGYQPVFREAELLTGKDVQIIKEVLNTLRQRGYDDPIVLKLLHETRLAIAEKTGTQSSLGNQEFLVTMVKDYNAVHQM